MNLILLEPIDIGDGNLATLTGSRARHLVQVLNAAVGRSVRVGLLNGPLGTGHVTEVNEQSVSLRCTFDGTPSRPRVDLLLALPRPKVLRRLWPQFAALGVGRVMLTNAERVERHYFDTHVLTESCFRPLLIEGLQQARDTWLPMVSVHKQFRVLIEDALPSLFPQGRRLVAHPESANRDMGLSRRSAGERVLLAVGPEGGWNDFELQLMSAHGFHAFDMGGRTLRTDTACIALLALVHNALAQRSTSGSASL